MSFDLRATLKRILGRDSLRTVSLVPSDIAADERFMRLYKRCAPFTMTSPERMYAQYRSVLHIVANGIEGAVVECGVWRGGSSMLAALTLLELGDTRRTIYLYDTYEGMPAPTAEDGMRAESKWQTKAARGELDSWCCASLEEVKANMLGTGYPLERLVFIRGKVEETIPSDAPERIALLRLDTDWYESTRHELEHLFPRLARGGILAVDDYGTWEGARKATDEYLAVHGKGLFLSRIDTTGAVLIKQ